MLEHETNVGSHELPQLFQIIDGLAAIASGCVHMYRLNIGLRIIVLCFLNVICDGVGVVYSIGLSMVCSVWSTE